MEMKNRPWGRSNHSMKFRNKLLIIKTMLKKIYDFTSRFAKKVIEMETYNYWYSKAMQSKVFVLEYKQANITARYLYTG